VDLVDRHAAELAEETQTPTDKAAQVRARRVIDETDVAAHASAGRPKLDLERPLRTHARDDPRRRGPKRAPKRGEKATDGASTGEEMEGGAER
jgi:hypothetical protein